MTAVDIAARWRGRIGRASLGGRAQVIEAIVLAAVVVAAAALRLVGLAARGTWDADQGRDMLILRALVRDGEIPLLGPPLISIGAPIHHGALYYYVLAPAAVIGRLDPSWVAGTLAVGGVLLVPACWLLARSLGAPAGRRVAGLTAALLVATSATAIASSVFIWNPNLVALFSTIAFGSAWAAWTHQSGKWWVIAGLAGGAAIAFHLLAVLVALPLVILFAADVLRAARARRRQLFGWGLLALLAASVSFLPLVVHEIQTGFAETRAAVLFLIPSPGHSTAASASAADSLSPSARLAFVGLRVLAWPLTGLITDYPLAGGLAAAAVFGFIGWIFASGFSASRQLVAAGPVASLLLAGTPLVMIVILAIGVSGLSTVTPLPTDQYHAFLDPLILVVVAVGIAAMWQRGRAGQLVALAALISLVGWNVAHWPPAVAPDGGWPAAQAAAQRIEKDLAGRPAALIGLPSFKPTDAYAFPLTQDGAAPVSPTTARALIVLCDSLFVPECGGPAESRLLAGAELGTESLPPEQDVGRMPLVDRFKPAPGRTISVFDLSGP